MERLNNTVRIYQLFQLAMLCLDKDLQVAVVCHISPCLLKILLLCV